MHDPEFLTSFHFSVQISLYLYSVKKKRKDHKYVFGRWLLALDIVEVIMGSGDHFGGVCWPFN